MQHLIGHHVHSLSAAETADHSEGATSLRGRRRNHHCPAVGVRRAYFQWRGHLHARLRHAESTLPPLTTMVHRRARSSQAGRRGRQGGHPGGQGSRRRRPRMARAESASTASLRALEVSAAGNRGAAIEPRVHRWRRARWVPCVRKEACATSELGDYVALHTRGAQHGTEDCWAGVSTLYYRLTAQ